jgi:hypothetical protein
MTAEIVDACAAMLLVGRVGEQASIMVIPEIGRHCGPIADKGGCETASAQQIMYEVWALIC